jgi:hypothetical protein
VVEAQPMTITEPGKVENAVTAEGTLTSVDQYSISLGSATFLLTRQTEYANITREGLEVGSVVKITAEVRNLYTYALNIELVSPPATPAAPETEEPATGEGEEEVPQTAPDGDEPDTVPAVPQ